MGPVSVTLAPLVRSLSIPDASRIANVKLQNRVTVGPRTQWRGKVLQDFAIS